MRNRVGLDQVGAVASFACAIHCAAIPIALGLSAGGAVSFLANRHVEWGLVLFAGVVGTSSAWRGYRRHGNKLVAVTLAAAALGLVLATAIRSLPADRAADVVSASATAADPCCAGDACCSNPLLAWIFPAIGCTIAVAHLVNLRLCRSCRGCGPACGPRDGDDAPSATAGA